LFFLFTDLFIYADKSPSSGKWILSHIFAWETLSVIDDNSRENALRINSGTSSFVVISKDLSDKQDWLSLFRKVGLSGRDTRSLTQAPVWIPDTRECMICYKKFSQIRRRHHCRRCGWVVCGGCSDHSRHLPGQGRVKVCNNCVKDIPDLLEETDSEYERPSSARSKQKSPDLTDSIRAKSQSSKSQEKNDYFTSPFNLFTGSSS